MGSLIKKFKICLPVCLVFQKFSCSQSKTSNNFLVCCFVVSSYHIRLSSRHPSSLHERERAVQFSGRFFPIFASCNLKRKCSTSVQCSDVKSRHSCLLPLPQAPHNSHTTFFNFIPTSPGHPFLLLPLPIDVCVQWMNVISTEERTNC